MYQKVKAEKALAEAERAKYEKLKNKAKRGEGPVTPEVLRKPVDIRDDPRYYILLLLLVVGFCRKLGSRDALLFAVFR